MLQATVRYNVLGEQAHATTLQRLVAASDVAQVLVSRLLGLQSSLNLQHIFSNSNLLVKNIFVGCHTCYLNQTCIRF